MADVWQWWRDALAGKSPAIDANEVWKPITASDIHEVSNYGRVRRICKNGYYRILKGADDGRGYIRVGLHIRGPYRVHRLVAEAFLPHDSERRHVNHKDGNPSNNRADNLEWVTHAENVAHAVASGLRDNCRFPGTRNGSAKLTEKDVLGIRSLYAKGFIQAELACLYDVSQRNISLIVRREKWIHI